MTHFTFLQAEWPAVFEAAGKAEAAVHPDRDTPAARPVPNAGGMTARKTGAAFAYRFLLPDIHSLPS